MNHDVAEVNGSDPRMLPGSFLYEKEPGYEAKGFIQKVGGGLEFPPPPPQPQFSPPRNLEIEYGYYYISYLILHVTGHTYVSSKCCLESLSQIASEAI